MLAKFHSGTLRIIDAMGLMSFFGFFFNIFGTPIGIRLMHLLFSASAKSQVVSGQKSPGQSNPDKNLVIFTIA